jgi:hypothetical protein
MLINWDQSPEGKLHNQSLDMNWTELFLAMSVILFWKKQRQFDLLESKFLGVF